MEQPDAMIDEPSKSPGTGAGAVAGCAAAAGQRQLLHLHLPAEQTSLTRVAESVRAVAESEQWPAELGFHVDLVLEELVQNTVSYGYPDGRQGRIELAIQQQGDALTIMVEDDGIPFDPFQQTTPDLAVPLEDREIGGLGIHFTRTLMDECHYQRVAGGNRIEMRKLLPGRAEPG